MEPKEATQTKINWQAFEGKSGDYFKPELGKKYRISFKPGKLSQGSRDGTETLSDGTKVVKQIPCLNLEIDNLDGKATALEYSITSKRLVQTIKTYIDEGLLFTRVFQLEKTGTGVETKYMLIALGDKPMVFVNG